MDQVNKNKAEVMQQDEKTEVPKQNIIYQNKQCHCHIMVDLILHSDCVWEQMRAWFNQSLPQEATATSKETEITWRVSDFFIKGLGTVTPVLSADGHTVTLPSDGSENTSLWKKKQPLSESAITHSCWFFSEIGDDGCYSSSARLSVMRSLLPTAASERKSGPALGTSKDDETQ